MNLLEELKKSLLVGCWFVFLTLPLVGLQTDYLEGTWEFKGLNLLAVFGLSILFSWAWRWLAARRGKVQFEPNSVPWAPLSLAQLSDTRFLLALSALLLTLPMVASSYQTGILSTAMIYIVLGLGLNIVVGMAGLLDLGYVAFYAVGAYAYGLLNLHFGLGFWALLPIAGMLAAVFGVMLGIPVLRLRGDYLAIVTLGFGEIIRLVLENWGEVTEGPSGIAGIPKPQIPGVELDFDAQAAFIYYLLFLLVLLAIGVNRRLQHSRMGRAWLALREDEIAAQAMGIDLTRTKLTAFGLGAFWAGIVGVVFAAKSSFINPASFTFHESAIILSIVVLGGMGSILGVVLAALVLILLPEYLRFLADYRMLIFGAVMVLTMVFKPEGLITNPRPTFERPDDAEREEP
ncbi:MAG: branched-chain amino acid ABC transporter permease [bacterium]|nr:branched-chain amino acid ABC transporter permease [bacterium]